MTPRRRLATFLKQEEAMCFGIGKGIAVIGCLLPNAVNKLGYGAART